MGELIHLPTRISGLISKKQVAFHLSRSTRWVELQMRDNGLPFSRNERGEARFDLNRVREWEAQRARSAING